MSADTRPRAARATWARYASPVARLVWGEPSGETASELRWGTHGSRVVSRMKGVWFDHERGIGGGTFELVPGATKKNRFQWLRERGLIDNAPAGTRVTCSTLEALAARGERSKYMSSMFGAEEKERRRHARHIGACNGNQSSRRLTDDQLHLGGTRGRAELIQGLLKPSHAGAMCRDTVLQRSR